jgi:hypothetical protein
MISSSDIAHVIQKEIIINCNNISMQYGALLENLLQTILSIDHFLETIHFSHIKLLKYCHKTQVIKKQCNNSLLLKLRIISVV